VIVKGSCEKWFVGIQATKGTKKTLRHSKWPYRNRVKGIGRDCLENLLKEFLVSAFEPIIPNQWIEAHTEGPSLIRQLAHSLQAFFKGRRFVIKASYCFAWGKTESHN
jgi:hypothetical protein